MHRSAQSPFCCLSGTCVCTLEAIFRFYPFPYNLYDCAFVLGLSIPESSVLLCHLFLLFFLSFACPHRASKFDEHTYPWKELKQYVRLALTKTANLCCVYVSSEAWLHGNPSPVWKKASAVLLVRWCEQVFR
eukprot:scpid82699/ scgid26781/ 